LPDRTPVRIAITISPDLNRSINAYAELYREAYGKAESIGELIPYILDAFLKSDHSFARARREGVLAERPPLKVGRHRDRKRRIDPIATSPIASEGE
jgi:hypothetical protein